MTVLDETIMTNTFGGDKYITPEYLAPLPQKEGSSDKSPLQLLAQTCSQIGTDNGPKSTNKCNKGVGVMRVHNGTDKFNKGVVNSGSPTIEVSDTKKVPFKPYENTKDITHSGVEHNRKSVSPVISTQRSNGRSESPKNYNSDIVSLSHSVQRPDEKRDSSVSPRNRKSSTGSNETTPTLSSGMEILAGHQKDVPLGTYRSQGGPGFDMNNPAFRLPFGGLPGYPPVSNVPNSVCRDPYCKDPSCPTSVYNAYMARVSAATRGLPPGYLELLEAQKMAALGMGGLQSQISNMPTSPQTSASLGPGGPYICNWMNGRDYCGKRWSSAEELLIHLKTHTNLSTSDSGLQNPNSMYAALLNTPGGAGLLRAPGSAAGPVLPSTLSLQSSRYSPYQRAGAPLPPSFPNLGASGLPSSLTGLPPHLSSLAGFPASLYALYGARL